MSIDCEVGAGHKIITPVYSHFAPSKYTLYIL